MANEIQAKVCLVIIDGWGHTDDYTAFLRTKIRATNNDIVLDAIEQANTPFYDKICQENGFLTLCASGQAVGLPENTIGNSQVGHITIGTGRCVKQPLLKIGDLFSQGKMNAILEENGLLNTNNHNRNILHMIGLASDGGIHSHMDHLIEMMKIFSHSQVYKKIILHLITDGRDTAPMSCLKYINTIFKKSEELNQKHGSNSVQIGSIAGRWYTMDRDNNKERYEKSFFMMTGHQSFENNFKKTFMEKIAEHVKKCYEKSSSDEMIVPLLIKKACSIQKEDKLLFFNFRTDRMKQITKHFYQSGYENIYTMTDYGLQCKKIKILVKEEIVSETLAEIISENGLKQTHIAETEKFAHVTYFFNGGNHFQYPNEERILVNSEKVDSFRDSPLMKAKEITYRTIEKMGENVPFIVINFANPDMVGHTGDFKATKVACEFISECLEKLHHFARSNFYNLLITADHGNAEKMADVNGPITKHTTSPVPFIAIGNNIRIKPDFIGSEQEHGLTLSSVAPTVLKILGIEPSKKMTGTCLVDFLNK